MGSGCAPLTSLALPCGHPPTHPVCCLVGGPVAALALSSAATPEAVTLAAFITAVVDVAMLIMWLCYFGYAKIGDIAFMIACSYALGSILYLAVVAAGETAMLVAAITSPILSGALFAYFVKNPPSLASEGLFQASPAADRRPKLPAALRRLAIGLTLYAFVFALFSSRTAVSEYTFSSGPLVQALASIVLAAVVIAAIRLSDASIGLYALYRSVPLVFGGGAALFLVLPAGLSLCAGFFIMFGYLLFEALSFNDFCNATKTNDGSLLRSMLIVRIAGSLGIFLGWVLGAPLSAALDPDQSSRLIIALCFVVVIVAASLVFTDKAMGKLGTIAGMRARQEAAEARLDKTRFIPLFATEHDLSKREAEVLEYLPRNCSSPSPPPAPTFTRYTRKPRPGVAWSLSTASSSSAPNIRKLNRARGYVSTPSIQHSSKASISSMRECTPHFR